MGAGKVTGPPRGVCGHGGDESVCDGSESDAGEGTGSRAAVYGSIEPAARTAGLGISLLRRRCVSLARPTSGKFLHSNSVLIHEHRGKEGREGNHVQQDGAARGRRREP